MSEHEGRLAGGAVFFRAWSVPRPAAHVVISHGYAEHSGRYSDVAGVLMKAGISVWAPDHRGHGLSDGERGDVGTWSAAVADLDSLLDVVAASGDRTPVFMVGHSLGGAIAIAYALAHQDRLAGLALSAPAIALPPEILALSELPEVPPLPLADAISRDPAVLESYKGDPLVHLGPPPPNLLAMMASVGSIVGRLGELGLPLLVMHGSADALIPPSALATVVGAVTSEDVTARLWPGLFHEILNEPTGGAVVGTLVDWLAERVG